MTGEGILIYLTDVAFRMEDDDVKFGRKEASQRDCGAQTDGDAHTGDPQRQMAGRTVIFNLKKCIMQILEWTE